MSELSCHQPPLLLCVSAHMLGGAQLLGPSYKENGFSSLSLSLTLSFSLSSSLYTC